MRSYDNYFHNNVKRSNLINMFLQGLEADRYITTHMYGEVQKMVNDNNETVRDSLLLDDILQQSYAQNLSYVDKTFLKKQYIAQQELKKIKKMNAFETYIALIKGYCGACILFQPKGFSNGGYIFSGIAMMLSCYFTIVCSLKLVQVGNKLRCYSYSEIVKKAFGQKGRIVLDFMVSLT